MSPYKKNPTNSYFKSSFFVLHLRIGQNTHRDICVEWFAVVSHILLSDIQHVNLRTGDHDANQGFVFGPSSLKTLDSTIYNWAQTHANFHPTQNVGSHLHGLVKSLCKVARSVFNALDWKRKKNELSEHVNPNSNKTPNINHCKKMDSGDTKNVLGWKKYFNAALVNISENCGLTMTTAHLPFWHIFEAYSGLTCLPSGIVLPQLTTWWRAADKPAWHWANRENTSQQIFRGAIDLSYYV